MNIQLANSEQFDEIIKVWESSVNATHHFLPENKRQELKLAILQQYLPNLTIFVSLDNHNNIMGFLGVDNNKLEMLFISAEHRGNGIGKQLLHFAIQQLKINEVDVNEQNPQAIGFYQHMGFEQISRSELDGEGNPFPILHMQLSPTI